MRIRRQRSGRNNYWKHAISYLLTVFCAAALAAQQKEFPHEKRLAIEKAVASFMSTNSVPGLSAAIVLDGEPRWSQGFGMADLENSSPATSSILWSPSPARSSTIRLTVTRLSAAFWKAPPRKNSRIFFAKTFSDQQEWTRRATMISLP